MAGLVFAPKPPKKRMKDYFNLWRTEAFSGAFSTSRETYFRPFLLSTRIFRVERYDDRKSSVGEL